MENPIFTNSALIRAHHCRKSYYLNLHYPELKDEVNGNHDYTLQNRKFIAKLTNHLFPSGKHSGIDVTGSCEMSHVLTKDLLNSDTKTIYNACFKYGEFFCFVDVMHRVNENWSAYEFWNKIDTNIHIVLTGSYQQSIIRRSGLHVSDYYSIIYNTTINGKDIIDLKYDILSIKKQINEYQRSLTTILDAARKTAKQNSIPDIYLGKHCTVPNKCDFYNYCKLSGNY